MTFVYAILWPISRVCARPLPRILSVMVLRLWVTVSVPGFPHVSSHLRRIHARQSFLPKNRLPLWGYDLDLWLRPQQNRLVYDLRDVSVTTDFIVEVSTDDPDGERIAEMLAEVVVPARVWIVESRRQVGFNSRFVKDAYPVVVLDSKRMHARIERSE